MLDDHTVDGRDLSPILLGETNVTKAVEDRVFYMFNNSDIAAVRWKNWKYVTRTRYITHNVNLEKHRLEGPGLLFDMNSDYEERYSLRRENPEVMEKMIGFLKDGRAELSAKKKK